MSLSAKQRAAIAASKKAAQDRRLSFADRYSRLVGPDLPTAPLVGVGRLPAWAVWTQDSTRLAVAVPAGESGTTVDKALAYGLFHAGDRELHVVLPHGEEQPTLTRAAFLTRVVTVWTERNGTLERSRPLSRQQAQDLLEERHGLRIGEHLLEPHESWVEELVADASANTALTAAHRGSYLAWHAYGMQVLRLQRSRSGIGLIAGINYTRPTERPPVTLRLSGPLTQAELTTVKGAIKAGIAAAKAREAGPYREHLLQENLTRKRSQVGWGEPDTLIREFPALRPRGSGFIDFLRCTADRELHLVETKIGLDPFVVLQGLDYWIWSRANAALIEQHLGRSISSTHVDYVLGDAQAGTTKAAAILSRYAAAHLPLLPLEMHWHVVKAAPIDSGAVRLESLPARSVPPRAWIS